VRTVRGLRRELTAQGALFWGGVSAVPWIAGALAHGAARGALWGIAVAMDYTGFALGFPAPKVGRTPPSEAPIGPEHLAERYRQFFIIALGELILVTGFAVGP
jgi:low temperature requirement protein LtrA